MTFVSRRTMLKVLGLGSAGQYFFSTSRVDAEEVSDELKAIRDKGRLDVAMTAFDNPPFFSETGNGFTGVDVSLANKIGEALGVPVKFDRRHDTFDAVLNSVATGQADIAVSKLGKTKEREKIVAFSQPYAQLRHALALNREKLGERTKTFDYSETLRKFNGTIGVIEHSVFANWARTRFPLAKVIEFKSWEDILKAVTAGDIDAAYRDEMVMRKILLDHPTLSSILKILVIVDMHDSIAVATPLGAKHILLTINDVINNEPIIYDAYYLIEHYADLNSGKAIE